MQLQKQTSMLFKESIVYQATVITDNKKKVPSTTDQQKNLLKQYTTATYPTLDEKIIKKLPPSQHLCIVKRKMERKLTGP